VCVCVLVLHCPRFRLLDSLLCSSRTIHSQTNTDNLFMQNTSFHLHLGLHISLFLWGFVTKFLNFIMCVICPDQSSFSSAISDTLIEWNQSLSYLNINFCGGISLISGEMILPPYSVCSVLSVDTGYVMWKLWESSVLFTDVVWELNTGGFEVACGGWSAQPK
jgi:hypothetical protein